MSWQDYIDTQLVATGAIADACILSAEDGSLWAHTGDYFPRAYVGPVMNETTGDEKDELINEADDLAKVVARTLQKPKAGLRVNYNKYLIVRTLPKGSMDDGMKTVYFKKAGGGGCLCVTNQCIIIGTFDESKQHTSTHCNQAVENLGRYLRENGF